MFMLSKLGSSLLNALLSMRVMPTGRHELGGGADLGPLFAQVYEREPHKLLIIGSNKPTASVMKIGKDGKLK